MKGIIMKVLRRIFIVYCILLTVLLLFKFDLSIDSILDKINSVRWNREQGAWNINLMPFGTISSQLSLFKSIPTIVIKNLAGNIVIFIPFGILLPMGYGKMRKCHRTLLAGLLYILSIESPSSPSRPGSVPAHVQNPCFFKICFYIPDRL